MGRPLVARLLDLYTVPLSRSKILGIIEHYGRIFRIICMRVSCLLARYDLIFLMSSFDFTIETVKPQGVLHVEAEV
ncbi:hypothetical protein LCGC14_1248470 [marine sediment metagenome]|uniref:Uncharacterized protein n=1 Tax=marine sediment metagenome TaxID=412755 RepID=A0A0F9L7I6_9ZZZZ